jgi:hypothetical protein
MFLVVADFRPRWFSCGNQPNSSPLTGQLESVDHECVLATCILSQRNPSDLGFAVFIVGNRNRKRVQEHGCGALKIQAVLSRLLLAFTGSHSNSYRNAAIVAHYFSLNGNRARKTAQPFAVRPWSSVP